MLDAIEHEASTGALDARRRARKVVCPVARRSTQIGAALGEAGEIWVAACGLVLYYVVLAAVLSNVSRTREEPGGKRSIGELGSPWQRALNRLPLGEWN